MLRINNSKTNVQSQLLLAKDLRKSYADRPALRGLTFSLMAGHILGFLGPNGAGKTTAIRILTTILEPDSGYFTVAGISSKYPERIRRKIGVLPENLGFPKNSTGIEYLTYFGQLYGRRANEARTNGLVLLKEVGLLQRAKSLIGSYSHGMRQRLGIARALINDPLVVFLDEPTLGLDPRGQQELLELIRQISRERNAGVLLCSHLLSEIEVVCDDVLILKLGRVIEAGTVAEVIGRDRSGHDGTTKTNSIRIQVPLHFAAKVKKVLGVIPGVFQVDPIWENAGWFRVEFADKVSNKNSVNSYSSNKILTTLIRAEIPIISFGPEVGRLQDAFLHLTEEVKT